ncbi:MAG: hypothetical protein FWF20_04775 [Betaproteobacteria bacterium]|nr:hypothetical protein [Betaproteobacteria bacterium]MCL2886092.1 hypothetical protein [Betaproteobacteria bacterium]
MNPVLAKILSLIGEAHARNGNGQLRRLEVGDLIYEGESVISTDAYQVVLRLADGRQLNVAPGDTVRIDAEVAGEYKPGVTDSMVIGDAGFLQGIGEALTRGGDFDPWLETLITGNADPIGEGSDFGELLRLIEAVDRSLTRA